VAQQVVSFNETVAGTQQFMSPEMISEKPNGVKTDVWSAGMTFCWLIGLQNVCPKNYNRGIP